MGPKVLFLAALLLATVVLLIVYECLLVTSQNTLRVAVSFPFPFQHKHTSIQLDITNELEGTVEDNGHVPAVNESAAGNVSDGMLQVRSEHLEEQQVASARVPSISLATLHKNSTTYETSISDNVNGMLPFHTEHLDKQQVPSAKVPSISPATLHENSTTYETSISDNLNGMLPLHTEHLDKQQVPSAKVPSISPVTLHENSTTYETSTNSDTSSEHTLPPTVTRSFSSPLTTVSKGEYLSSTNQLPSTLQSSRPVDIISTKRPSLPKILLYQNASISNVMIQPTVGTTSNQVASTISSHRDIPRTSSPRCKQRYCMEHLLSHEKLVYIRCLRRVPMGKDMDCRCQFVAGMGRRVVALVSLPGSGNTWVRGLLEKATGVCTGSIYCDKTLRAEGFCGEGIRSGSALVVKTHDSILQWKGERPHDSVRRDRPFFDAAIFLIRSPFRAAVAEWNREVSSRFARDQNGSNHVKYVDRPQFFGELKYHIR